MSAKAQNNAADQSIKSAESLEVPSDYVADVSFPYSEQDHLYSHFVTPDYVEAGEDLEDGVVVAFPQPQDSGWNSQIVRDILESDARIMIEDNELYSFAADLNLGGGTKKGDYSLDFSYNAEEDVEGYWAEFEDSGGRYLIIS